MQAEIRILLAEKICVLMGATAEKKEGGGDRGGSYSSWRRNKEKREGYSL